MREPFPDIEIYLKRPAVDDVVAWLDRRLGVKARDRRGDSLRLSLGDEPIQCTLVENAVKGGYMSVWFKSSTTPWESDHDCAQEAFREIGVEVRCSTGSWQEDDDTPGWWRITDKGETKVNWL